MSTPVLPALIPLPGQQPGSTGGTGSQSGLGAMFSGTSLDFKTKFAAAMASLSSSGAPLTVNGTSTTGTTSNKLDALQSMLQKKIADMLAQGQSLSDIVQQLASSLASQFAGQFAGDPTQIRAQLQSAFAAALSPPGTTGPPSIADTASALAQRFRQVAEVAAGVNGETGQSNRLFAGSNSDAATTAGVAPAPQQTNTTTGSTTADSILSGALNASANLTVAPGDGKTVALADAPAVGSNGDTPIGRMLARALLSLQSSAAPPAPVTPVTSPAAGTPSTGNSTLTPLSSVTSALLAATAPDDGTQAPAVSTTSAGASTAPVSPALTAFLNSFATALAANDSGTAAPTIGKDTDSSDGTATLLATSVTSSNAPTVTAFVPVQPPFTLDPTNANAPQSTNPTAAAPPVDPNSIVDQVLQGAFLQTDGTTSTVRLSLVPASLGDVSVHLTVDGGNVSANVIAQTPAAYDALVAGQTQLSHSLANAGLTLNGFNVSLAGGFTSFQQQQQQSSTQSQSSGRRLSIAGIDNADDGDESSLLAMPSFGPPILANLNWGNLNYLA